VEFLHPFAAQEIDDNREAAEKFECFTKPAPPAHLDPEHREMGDVVAGEPFTPCV
jgi:hypothetical protein